MCRLFSHAFFSIEKLKELNHEAEGLFMSPHLPVLIWTFVKILHIPLFVIG